MQLFPASIIALLLVQPSVALNVQFPEGSPTNSALCPATEPETREACVFLGNEICQYRPVFCPGGTEPIYIAACRCHEGSSSMLCLISEPECTLLSEIVPTVEPVEVVEEEEPDDLPLEAQCPEQEPDLLNACSSTPDEECTYQPFSCPGSDVLHHLSSCRCNNSSFFVCNVTEVDCGDEPDELAVAQNEGMSPDMTELLSVLAVIATLALILGALNLGK